MNLPSQTGVIFLNNLPEDIRIEGNLRKFRYRRKRFLILEELYDVGEFWIARCRSHSASGGVAGRSFISLPYVNSEHVQNYVLYLIYLRFVYLRLPHNCIIVFHGNKELL
jgi:hypothetical protein